MAHKVVLFVQPAYNYSSGEVEYAEVLIRNYRGLDKVPNILRFVHRNNIEESFDLEVLNETLDLLSKYNKKPKYPIGVNLCSESIAKEDIADKIIYNIDSYGISHDTIVIEVNEHTDFKNDIVKKNIHKLRKAGIRIALDDFGIDNSNLYSLMNCDIDILKVDRAFIDNNSEHEESQHEILKALIQLCNALNLKHIVEGIETSRQLKKIQNLGYSVVQGYLYERPIPFDDFIMQY